MTDEPKRFPLSWPPGRARKTNRTAGKFSADGKPITIGVALSRLTAEIERLGGRDAVLSTNYRTRLDGTLILNEGRPLDPGVAVYFKLKGEPYVMACDTYYDAAQNLAAIAGHIESTRRIERYGVATAAEALQSFRALPPPAPEKPITPWWQVFGVMREQADEDTIGALYRVKAKAFASREDVLAELNVARDAALADIRARTAVVTS